MSVGSRVRRWVRVARLDGVSAGLVAVFVALRLVATLDRPIAVFPDTASYFEFHLWGGVRLPVVTGFYSLIGDHRAIVVAQAVLGAACWSAAVLVAGSVIARPGARRALQAAVLSLGLTASVATFDDALLSESLTLSLTVLLVAIGLRFACRPTRATAIALLVVAAAWALTRQSNGTLLVVAAVALAALGARRRDRRLVWPLAGALVVTGVVSVVSSSTAQIREYNSAQIVVRRVLADDAREAWFRDRGMPADGDALLVPPYENRFGDPAVELQEDPTFGPWLRDDFPGAYLRYLVTHPGYTVGTPFGADGGLTPLATGTAGYGQARRVLPELVERLWWPESLAGRRLAGAVVVGILVAGAVAAVRSPARRRAAAGAGVVVLVTAASLVLVTHTAGWEYERLLLPAGVAVRVALAWLLAVVVGGVASARD